MSLVNIIKEALEHYDYVLMSITKPSSDNIIHVNFPTTNLILFRYLTIIFGAGRVSKSKGMIKVTE